MTYKVDGTTASLAPFSQRPLKAQVGTDHNGAPLYSGVIGAVLSFDAASITYHQQWLNTVDGASHSYDILGEISLGYTTLSPAYASVDEWPSTEATISQPFTLTLRKKG